MIDTRKPARPSPETVPRTLRYRLYPGNADTGRYLVGIAGAGRYVRNHMLADCVRRYALWRAYRIGPSPSVSFCTLSQRFAELCNDPDYAWLRTHPFACARYSLKYLADAYRAFFQGGGFPRYKARHFTTSGFTIPDDVDIEDGRLRVPKVGWLRMEGSDPYAGCQPRTVRVRMESTAVHPKGYAYVTYAVPVNRVRQGAVDGKPGLDRNVGQATDSAGTVHALPGTAAEDARIKRCQRKLARLHRKRRRRRDATTHRIRRELAATARTVVPEDLHTKAMTASARGTAEKPGTKCQGQSGLNRSLLASGWGQLEWKLDYKAGTLIKVNPAYTSQTCSACRYTDKANRPLVQSCM